MHRVMNRKTFRTENGVSERFAALAVAVPKKKKKEPADKNDDEEEEAAVENNSKHIGRVK